MLLPTYVSQEVMHVEGHIVRRQDVYDLLVGEWCTIDVSILSFLIFKSILGSNFFGFIHYL